MKIKESFRNILGVSVLLSMFSCQQNTVMDYALDGKVYFYERAKQGTAEVKVEEKNYSFALQNSALMEDTLKIKVRLMGYVDSRDRIFRAEPITQGTTAVAGTHYKLLDGVMKAGEYDSYLPVVIYRTEDTKETPVSLVVKLIDSPDLTPGNADDITFTMGWGDILMKPDHWPDYFFGTYSINKYRFAIDRLGLTDWPSAGRETAGKEEGVYTTSELQRFSDQLNRDYQDYRQEYGPIYEDDNADPKVEIYFGQR